MKQVLVIAFVIAAIKSPNKSGESGGEEKEEWRTLRRKRIKRQRE